MPIVAECSAELPHHSVLRQYAPEALLGRFADDGRAVTLVPGKCHPDGRPVASFKKGFEQILGQAGVLYDSDGKRRVPYSLRHTYATMRISEGVSVYQLAANMGTSVEMIENFYGRKRMRDPKMATEVTKFRAR